MNLKLNKFLLNLPKTLTASVLVALPFATTACDSRDLNALSPDAYSSENAPGHLPFSGNEQRVKIALKYVEYEDSKGKPVLDQNEIKHVTDRINQLYSACNIQFIAEQYTPVQPKKLGLDFNTQSMNELNPIRSQFTDTSRLVVVNTGDWDHSTMGTANAWTAMPGESPAGAVIEAEAASFAGIVAHELGHYLSLDHVDDSSNMMNPVIYNDSTTIDASQCKDMRKTAIEQWAGTLR